MSDAFAIKPNYGLFNFLKKLAKDGSEKVIPEFAEITLKAHLDHINAFISVIKTIIQISPDTYKAKIQNDTAQKFKFLRKVSEWSTRDAKLAFVNLETLQSRLQIVDYNLLRWRTDGRPNHKRNLRRFAPLPQRGQR